MREAQTQSGPHGASDRAIATLREWIGTGRLPVGGRLPTESALCQQLGVSRTTVRKALSDLEEAGLIGGAKGCTRTVTGLSHASRGFMARTVAMLTDFAGDAAVEHHGGSVRATEVAAFRRLQERGYHCLTIQPSRLDDQGFDQITQQLPAGVILTAPHAGSAHGQRIIERFAQLGVAVVVNSRQPELGHVDRVRFDHYNGAAMLTRLAHSRGARRMIQQFGADPQQHWAVERRRGHVDAMRALGLDAMAPIAMHRLSEAEPGNRQVFDARVRQLAGYFVEHLIGPEPVDAILLSSDAVLAASCAACRLLRKTPQKDVLLFGYDNRWQTFGEFEFEPTPPIATVDKHNALAGEKLVDLLLDRIEGRLPDGPQDVVIDSELIVIDPESRVLRSGD